MKGSCSLFGCGCSSPELCEAGKWFNDNVSSVVFADTNPASRFDAMLLSELLRDRRLAFLTQIDDVSLISCTRYSITMQRTILNIGDCTQYPWPDFGDTSLTVRYAGISIAKSHTRHQLAVLMMSPNRRDLPDASGCERLARDI